MAAAMVPRKQIRTEMFLMDRWVNVSDDIRHASGVEITYGSSSQDRSVPPAKMSAVLENGSERYSRRNPLSPNYGKLGSNIPTRVTLGLTADLFGRTTANGWGTGTYDDVWSTFLFGGGSAADFATSGGVATHVVGATNSYRASYMPAQLHRNVDVAVTCILGISNITGNDIEPCNIMMRGVSTTDYAMVRVVITAAEVVTVKVSVAGVDYSSAVTVPGLTFSGQAFRVRAQAEGGTIRAKVWAVSTSVAGSDGEPETWHVEAAVPDSAVRAGWVGVRSGVAAGNTNVPVTFGYSNFEVRSNRFIGEASTTAPSWNLAQTDRKVTLGAAGLLQRLQKGSTPLKSTLRRSIPTQPDLLAYWPMEDGSEATSFASALPGVDAMYIDPAGDQTLSTFDEFPCSQPLPTVNFAVMIGAVPNYTSTGEIQTRFLIGVPDAGVPSNSPIMRIWTNGGTIAYWDVRGGTGSNQLLIVASNGSTDVLSSLLGMDLHGKNGRLSLELKQNGANIDWGLWFLEVGSGAAGGITGTLNTQTLGVAQRLNFSLGYPLSGTAIGHATVEKKVTSVFALLSQLNAFDGETATTRMSRLCSEEGVQLSISGTADADAKMGFQRPDTLVNLLKDCAKLDMGILGESRGRIGLKYRTRLSMLDQTVIATIDRTRGQLSAPFAPTDDDRLTVNDVTVKRVNGSEVHTQQLTGPLSVSAPPAGAGRYDTDTGGPFNAWSDLQLTDLAGWLLSLGTVDEYRYPSVVSDMAVTDVEKDLTLVSGLLSLDIGDLLAVTGLAPLGIYDDVNQVAHGYTETLYPHAHTLTANTFPASPYAALKLDDSVLGRADSGSSTTNASFSASATSFTVATSDVNDLWVTGSGSDFPMDVMVAGERIRISSISGASSPQTFTVAAGGRAINGVVKDHVSGEAVHVITPVHLA